MLIDDSEERMIRIWWFDDAPERYQELAKSNEWPSGPKWVVVVPENYRRPGWIWFNPDWSARSYDCDGEQVWIGSGI